MTMLQLDPPLPVVSAKTGEKGMAFLVIDYGVEHDLVWVVAVDDTREIWCVRNPDLRVQRNITFGRTSSGRGCDPRKVFETYGGGILPGEVRK